MRVALFVVLVSSLVAACSPFGTSADAAMCDVAGSLSAAKTLVEQAAAKDANGDKAGAQQLASDAAALAKRGNDLLQTITSSDVRQGHTWQALLDAYLHIGEADTPLLPPPDNTPRITHEALATVAEQLRAASAGLPARCFMATPPPAGSAPASDASG